MNNDVTVSLTDNLGEDGIRLYLCDDCKQIIPIPTIGTPLYHHDVLLHAVEEDHGWRGHRFAVITVDRTAWDDEGPNGGRAKIVAQIKGAVAGGETGFGSAFYDVKETFKADALACWAAHRRTPDCTDYLDDSKRIQPGTNAARKAEGLERYRSNQYLCHHCPVHSLVTTDLRKRAGMYDN